MHQSWAAFFSRVAPLAPHRAGISNANKLLSAPARQTNQLMPKMFLPSLGRCNPPPLRPWRIVPDVLLMPALQLRNPIPTLIEVKANNLSWNPA